MATIKHLPTELWTQIFAHLNRADLRNCNQVLRSPEMNDALHPRLFRKIHFSILPESLSKLQAIAAHEKVRNYVTEIILHPFILNIITGEKPWRRVFHPKLWGRKFSHKDYTLYNEIAGLQLRFQCDPELPTKFGDACRSFARLTTFREVPIFEELPDPCGCLYNLRLKDLYKFHFSSIESSARTKYAKFRALFDGIKPFKSSMEIAGDVYRSCEFATKTIAARLFLPNTRLLKQGRGDLSVSLGMPDQLGIWADFCENSVLHAPDDATCWVQTLNATLQAIYEAPSLSTLGCLSLEIWDGDGREQFAGAFKRLADILNGATALDFLHIKFSGFDREDHVDCLAFLSNVRAPNLKFLRLSGHGHEPGEDCFTMTLESLENLLANHTETLRFLYLERMVLLEEVPSDTFVSTRGPWANPILIQAHDITDMELRHLDEEDFQNYLFQKGIWA